MTAPLRPGARRRSGALRLRTAGALALLGVVAGGCLSDRAPHDRRKAVVLPDLSTEPPNAARTPSERPRPSSSNAGPLRGYVNAHWVQARLGSKSLRILDVRPALRYHLGHLPGSINDPGGHALLSSRAEDPNLGPPHYAEALQDATVVLVHAGRSARDLAVAARAHLLLHSTGIPRRIAVLRGGYAAWKQQRRPLATEARQIHRGKAPRPRAAKPAKARARKKPQRPQILWDAPSLAALRKTARVVMVDARPTERPSRKRNPRPVTGAQPDWPSFDIAALYTGNDPGVGPARRVLRRLLRPLLEHRKTLRLVPFSRHGLWASLLWFSLRSELNLPDVFDAVYFGVPER